MATSIGIDIGGTKIAGAVVASDGTVLARDRRESEAGDSDALVNAVAEVIAGLVAAAPSAPVACGVACAGFIDRVGETVMFAPNMAWRDEPLKARVEAACALPVHLENDANAAAWGEFRFGAARDCESMVLFTVGTGIGGGAVLGGQLWRGHHGVGTEFGHMVLVPDGQPCGCGKRGCLEAYASGTALVRNARAAVVRGGVEAAVLAEACGGDPAALVGRMVDQAAMADDPLAVGLLAEVGGWLGAGAASVCAALDPEVVVVGGGVSHAGELLVGPARAALHADQDTGNRPRTDLVAATLGNDAGVVGVADQARLRYAPPR